ncbi:protein ALTERED PHOSPHATE STARVATION RESPONSE 1-like [Bidens hawaiensis]|uniref:protein ALTERED PHOSPHATE STARVATION RESPONSE 1-like n=1 Tax=Bidens hawaiensis TaxID=980011 RepID=UPI00404A2D73
MGISQSKTDKCEALKLCKQRKIFIKQAIDSRYDFSAAHLAYTQSLREIGIALRRFAESELLLDSPSPPHASAGAGDQPPVSTVSYMRSSATNAVTVSLNPSVIDISSRVSVDDIDTTPFTMPPPPPPPESGSSWDYFDPADEPESFRFVGHDGFHVNFNNMSVQKQFSVKDTEQVNHDDVNSVASNSEAKAVEFEDNESGAGALVCRVSQTESNKDSCCLTEGLTEAEEDPTEFITHRAKDFLSSIKEIEGRFFSACESGKEVSKMLEVDKTRVGCSESKGSSNASNLLCGNCRKGKTTLISHDVANIITWKRSTSLHSSSSRNPLAPTSKDANNDDSGSDFFEECCMIAGSHSSTLDRLYAWERKLYDEVKASESIRKVYDRKCDQLRHQFAKDLKSHVIDKTRAIVKDLHSRIIVALHTVDSISKRIEKMRDEELQPQILELIQGLNRMWKAMLECHHAQYITISLAYYLKKSKSQQQEPKKPIIDELQQKIEHFGLSFTDMVNSQTVYVESVNSWLQNCIIQPKERSKKRAFSPRRSVGPPILVICRDWSAGIQGLPAQQVSDSIEAFLSHLNEHSVDEGNTGLTEDQEDEGLKLQSMHSSLTKVLDALTKFSECSLKMYEDIKMKGESAQKAYSNYSHRPPPRAFSI